MSTGKTAELIQWTAEDEAQLQALEERKQAARAAKRERLERIIDHHFRLCTMCSSTAVGDLMEHADELVAALKPFMKEPA